MKNKIKSLGFLILFLPSIVYAEEDVAHGIQYISCGNDRLIPLAFANVFSTIMTIIRIIIPILMVIMGMISYLKAVMSSKPKENMKKSMKQLINSAIAAVVIFFITSILNFVVGVAAGKNNSAIQCLSCMIRPEKCSKVEKKEPICPGLMGQEYDENCGLKNKEDTNNDTENQDIDLDDVNT